MRNKIAMFTACMTLFVAASLPAGAQVSKARHRKKISSSVQSVKEELTDKGYQPATLKLKRGVPARITFVRRIEETCGKEIAIPEYNIRRALPLNEPVVVEFTPNKSGEFNFTCGMGMLRGTVIVR